MGFSIDFPHQRQGEGGFLFECMSFTFPFALFPAFALFCVQLETIHGVFTFLLTSPLVTLIILFILQLFNKIIISDHINYPTKYIKMSYHKFHTMFENFNVLVSNPKR